MTFVVQAVDETFELPASIVVPGEAVVGISLRTVA
jgi:hypothetical protein